MKTPLLYPACALIWNIFTVTGSIYLICFQEWSMWLLVLTFLTQKRLSLIEE
jgi:hypothetical protein